MFRLQGDFQTQTRAPAEQNLAFPRVGHLAGIPFLLPCEANRPWLTVFASTAHHGSYSLLTLVFALLCIHSFLKGCRGARWKELFCDISAFLRLVCNLPVTALLITLRTRGGAVSCQVPQKQFFVSLDFFQIVWKDLSPCLLVLYSRMFYLWCLTEARQGRKGLCL